MVKSDGADIPEMTRPTGLFTRGDEEFNADMTPEEITRKLELRVLRRAPGSGTMSYQIEAPVFWAEIGDQRVQVKHLSNAEQDICILHAKLGRPESSKISQVPRA